jgi:hypothetical protein
MALLPNRTDSADSTGEAAQAVYNRPMATIEEKLERLEAANALVESLVAKGIDLRSKEALPAGLELIHAVDALAQEFGYQILKERTVE